MKKNICALLAALSLALTPAALALGGITMTTTHDKETGSSLVIFSAGDATPQGAPGKQASLDPVVMAINMQIGVRFEQEAAEAAAGRAGAQVVQRGRFWQDGKIASMARMWQGEQADGTEGSSAAALTVSLETGMEIYLADLFDDPKEAFAAMERIIEDDVLQNMSDYMEYSDLLPMPTNSFSLDETGLTVYWDEDSYRYFDGTSGSVTFYWYELADFIDETSPVYALAHPDVGPNPETIRQRSQTGYLGDVLDFSLGIEPSYATLGDVKFTNRLADPDYTTDARVYPLERVRGYSVEIPKYAETEEDETPLSAIRATRISLDGMLVTGRSTEADVVQYLGEPVKTQVFDEDDALDALLDPGVSLYYEMRDFVLQLHVSEEDVLSCVILRREMPES